MATQSLYKQAQVDLLRRNVEQMINLEYYRQDSCPFPVDNVLKVVGVNKPDNLLEDLMRSPQNEIECAKIIFNAYKNLTPLQAADTRLWVYIAHVELHQYMRERWRIEDIVLRTKPDGTLPKRDEVERDYILDHWFGGFMRQAISNLWWSVYETIDNERDNPFELTEFLFKHYDFRTRRFASSVFARNREGMIGLLDAMRQLDTYKEHFEARSNFAIMYFNYLGGTRQLSALDRHFFMNEMIRIDEEVRKYLTRDDIKANKDHLFDNLA